MATTTTLAASTTSTQYDTSIVFTARVTARHATPTGSVTFSDASNGSVLDTATLSAGTATLTTASLAPGTRQIVASYAGGTGFAPSASTALNVAVASGSQATTYQTDARHDGDQQQGELSVSTLSQKWQVTLGGTGSYLAGGGDVSYPVIAGGRVFVTVENTTSYGTVLYALDQSTGATDWSAAIAGTYGFSALTYDGQHVFVVNFNGVLTDFDAGTGSQVWSMQLPGQYAFTAPPTAYNGVVYISGAGSGGTVYGVSEADAAVRWTASVENGDKSSPAVDESGAYVSYACKQDYRFTLAGAAVWHHSTGCEGGGGSTAVLHGSSLYARGAQDTPLVLSTADGTQSGTFASSTAPALDATNMYTLSNGNLVAVGPSGSPNRWTFGNGTLVTAPIVYGGTVFVGSSTGTVYGVSASTGAQVWSGTAGTTIVGPDEQNADVLVGMEVGANMLFVPASNVLTAFG
jgi:outer membrane protein assembly factor BamB